MMPAKKIIVDIMTVNVEGQRMKYGNREVSMIAERECGERLTATGPTSTSSSLAPHLHILPVVEFLAFPRGLSISAGRL